MTESQRIVLNWKAELKGAGWPEDQIRRIVTELVEAGYRQALDDVQKRAQRDEAVIQRAVAN